MTLCMWPAMRIELYIANFKIITYTDEHYTVYTKTRGNPVNLECYRIYKSSHESHYKSTSPPTHSLYLPYVFVLSL